jgi:uncharacterized membrane protein
MEANTGAVLTIAGMALATYLTRASGLWLMENLSPNRRIDAWLQHIPGALMISIVAPAVIAEGPAEWIAATITLLVAVRSKSLLLAMVVGIIAVVGLRSVL